MKFRNSLLAATLCSLFVHDAAAVTAEEAAALKTTLTPLGGERAGNKDGTIPPWTGGYTTPIPDDRQGGRGDPFKDEKPLFSISSKNMDQYADKLADGIKAMLGKYPSFRLDVYRTHRTASAPQWVYDNTYNNATRAKLDRELVQGAYGGIPFPIPKSGAEVMWNHILHWGSSTWRLQTTQYEVTAEGKAVLVSTGVNISQSPYYFQDSTSEQFARSNEYSMIRVNTESPPIRAGEAIVVRNHIDHDKTKGWVYLTGQRRVRRLPNPCCDTPSPPTAGVMTIDEIGTFQGRLDRFDWKLSGKKEMFIPYNVNRLARLNADEALSKHHLNPDHVRWELHRVWIVEATLRQGERHLAPKSRYYCDEDTWICVLGDRWDAKGQLWRTLWSGAIVAPDMPGVRVTLYGMHDLLSGTAFFATSTISFKPRYPDSVFTPDAIAGEGIR
jgi:hypothetical protein